MDATTLLADPSAIHLECFVSETNSITLVIHSIQEFPRCPKCNSPSTSLHSHYQRTVADLPWHGVAIKLELHTRKFRCKNEICEQKVFCERLPKVVDVYARKTVRLNSALTLLAFALGGEAGARTAKGLNLSVSGDTLLRGIRSYKLPENETPKVLGVDDWAKRKGQTYGTILVDLEKRKPIDLLSDREADTLADWLKAHPGVEIITRDRAGAYADGARRGAPEASQVADRWHLLKNATELLEHLLGRYRTILRQATHNIRKQYQETLNNKSTQEGIGESNNGFASASTRSEAEQERSRQFREARSALYKQVKELQKKGLTINDIRHQLGITYGVAQRFYNSDIFPERMKRQKRSQMDAYEPYLRQRWEEGCRNSKQLLREVRQRGCRASWTTVRRYVQGWRELKPKSVYRPPPIKIKLPQAHPRTITWLLLNEKEKLTEEEQEYVSELLNLEPNIKKGLELIKEFRQIIRERKEDALTSWMQRANLTGLVDFENFVQGLERDESAVRGALSSKWSNGQTEGQVNRLKFIKRQMFGRAKFDLLKARVLHAI